MPKATKKSIRNFSKRLDACLKSVNIAKLTETSIELRRLVKDDPKAAAQLVEIYCGMENNPTYLQGALLLASAYYVEFNDDYLLQIVQEEAREEGAEDSLSKISFLKDVIILNQGRIETETNER
jgi:hypothetical protein